MYCRVKCVGGEVVCECVCVEGCVMCEVRVLQRKNIKRWWRTRGEETDFVLSTVNVTLGW